jgi:hypothetical protein
MIRIPRFEMDELIEIQKILNNNNIKYEKKSILIGADQSRGYNLYDLLISKNDLLNTVKLIKNYFGIYDNKNLPKFSGNCPACNTELLNVIKCIDCGLVLAGDYSEVYAKHPFIQFLKKEGLY